METDACDVAWRVGLVKPRTVYARIHALVADMKIGEAEYVDDLRGILLVHAKWRGPDECSNCVGRTGRYVREDVARH